MLDHAITTEGEVADLLVQLEDAKQRTYISAFANVYIEMVAVVD